MSQEEPLVCPVCGYRGLTEPPREPSGGGSYEICVCCGFQFGVDDDDHGIDYAEWRSRWIADGMPWFSSTTRPPSAWNASEQLRRLPGSG